jgi:hypothetical protein
LHEKADNLIMLDPESHQIREVYARFGLAMYLAQNIERGLAMALAVNGHEKIMTAWDYDARLAENYKATFGTLVSKFIALADSEYAEMAERLTKANDRRNELAHHYFWDRAIQFCSDKGRAEMIDELDHIRDEFTALDEELCRLAEESIRRRGYSPELLRQRTTDHLEDLLSGHQDPHSPELVPDPVEIVAAFEWRSDSVKPGNLVLLSKEGRYLVPGEKGLCYGPKGPPVGVVVVEADFEQALPAVVSPRSKTSIPWNFGIQLANQYILRARSDHKNGATEFCVWLQKPKLKKGTR